MRHLKRVTVAKASAMEGEKQDVFGYFFLQLWLTMLGFILTKGFD
jgi:hypothetical protein